MFYFSNRVIGYKPSINIPITSSAIPDSLKRVSLRVEVRGRTYEKDFPAKSNLNYKFVWDRRDAYGRIVFGQIPATGMPYRECP